MKAWVLNSKMVEVTADQWADKLSGIDCYATEGDWPQGYSVMFHRTGKDADTDVGEVHYLPDGQKVYKVLPDDLLALHPRRAMRAIR